jgi:hypothetical protein
MPSEPIRVPVQPSVRLLRNVRKQYAELVLIPDRHRKRKDRIQGHSELVVGILKKGRKWKLPGVVHSPSGLPIPARNPPKAKAGTATAGLHIIDQVLPTAPIPKLTSAPMPPNTTAESTGLRYFFVLVDIDLLRLPVLATQLGFFLRLARPAGWRHSGRHSQPGKNHRLKQNPPDQNQYQPDCVHDILPSPILRPSDRFVHHVLEKDDTIP